eukprot:Platyproteum_vivax@DN54_c0_g1_i2.p2
MSPKVSNLSPSAAYNPRSPGVMSPAAYITSPASPAVKYNPRSPGYTATLSPGMASPSYVPADIKSPGYVWDSSLSDGTGQSPGVAYEPAEGVNELTLSANKDNDWSPAVADNPEEPPV